MVNRSIVRLATFLATAAAAGALGGAATAEAAVPKAVEADASPTVTEVATTDTSSSEPKAHGKSAKWAILVE